MNPDASPVARTPGASRQRGGLVWPSVIAILFATLSVISFAVDQTVTFSALIEAPPYSTAP